MRIEIVNHDGLELVVWTLHPIGKGIEMRGGFIYRVDENFPIAQALSTDVVTVTPDPKR